jgi:osmotically inducible protein OsmC
MRILPAQNHFNNPYIIADMKRTSTAVWNGSGLEGKGSLTTQSGVFQNQPYSFKTRFQNEDGKAGTNPEELIAAAHAGCFNMALSFQLVGAGFTADELHTTAALNLEKDKEGDGFTITTVHLDLKAKVPGIDQAKFQELADRAKQNCPVSKVLNATITMTAQLG